MAIALKMLRRRCPGLRLVVSYAAGEQGHHGGIYQAGGWTYAGPMDSHGFKVKGRFVHSKSIHSRYGHGSQSRMAAQASRPEGRKGGRPGPPQVPDAAGRRDAGEDRADGAALSETRVKQAMAGPTRLSGGAAPTHTLSQQWSQAVLFSRPLAFAGGDILWD